MKLLRKPYFTACLLAAGLTLVGCTSQTAGVAGPASPGIGAAQTAPLAPATSSVSSSAIGGSASSSTPTVLSTSPAPTVIPVTTGIVATSSVPTATSSVPRTVAPSSTPTTTSSTSTSDTTSSAPTTTSTSSAHPAPPAHVLGPNGYVGVVLGESAAVASKDSLFVDPTLPDSGAENSCAAWNTVSSSPIAEVVVSAKLGVIEIVARAGADIHTPEGLTFGWTAAKTHNAYPAFTVDHAHDEDEGPEIEVPQNPAASYVVGFDSSNVATRLALQLDDEDCYD